MFRAQRRQLPCQFIALFAQLRNLGQLRHDLAVEPIGVATARGQRPHFGLARFQSPAQLAQLLLKRNVLARLPNALRRQERDEAVLG